MEFLKGTLTCAGGLAYVYGIILGIVVAGGLVVVIARLSWRGLELAGILALLAKVWFHLARAWILVTRAWARVITEFKRILGLARRAWIWARPIIASVSLVLLVALSPWLLFYLCLNNRLLVSITEYAVGSVIISLPVCLFVWPILLRLDDQKPKLHDLPKVLGIALFWVAPFVGLFPLVMVSD